MGKVMPRPLHRFRAPGVLLLVFFSVWLARCDGDPTAANVAGSRQVRAAIEARLAPGVPRRDSSARQSAEACVPYRGSPATAGKCDDVVTYANVYLQPGQTYESVDAAASEYTKLAGAYVPHECRQALVKFVCVSNFLQCSVNATTFEPSVLLPCRSTCEKVLLECTVFAESNNLESFLPDCDRIITVDGKPIPAFPPDGVTPCTVPPSSSYVSYGAVDCPYPLLYNYDGEPHFEEKGYDPSYMCLYPCSEDQATFTTEQWNAMLGITVILNFFSFWLSLFLVVSFLMMPSKRHFPAVIFLYLAAISTVVGFVCLFFPAVRGGIEPLICTSGNPPRKFDMDNAGEDNGAGVPCIIQGMFTYYCPLAAMFWWVLLTAAVFELVVLEHSTTFITRIHYFYHGVAWGLPLIGLIIMLAGKQIASIGNTVCFFKGKEEYTWPLFYAPLTLGLIIGTVLMAIAIVKFVKIRFRFKGQTRNKIEQLIRMILLVAAFWLILLYPLVFYIYQQIVKDDLEQAVADQVACGARTGTRCEAEMKLNYGATLLQLMDVSCYGIVIFLTMCSTDIFVWWYNLNKTWYTTPPRDAWEITKDMVLGRGGWDSKTATHSHSASRSKNSISKSVDDDSVDQEDTTNSDDGL